jgi:hypothetical protein
MMAGVGENDAGGTSDEPTPPRGLNAEEYRRFLEFQRFQEYQRFVETQQRTGSNLPVPITPSQPAHPAQPPAQSSVPPPPPPPHAGLEAHLAGMRQQLARIEKVTNPPTWQKILRNKWLHRAIWLVIIVALASWGVPKLIQHYFGGNDQAAAGSGAALHPGEIQGSGRLETNPKDAVAAVYHIIAESPPDTACLEFSVPARAQFATDLHAPTCLQAVRTIHAGLNAAGVDAYSFVEVPDAALVQQGATATISSCAMGVDAGPRLGLFTLTQDGQQEWRITGHSNEPNPCPALTTTTAAPPS